MCTLPQQKVLPKQLVTQKKAQRLNIKRQDSSLSPPPHGAVRGHQVAIAHAQPSAKYFTACFLFFLFYFLCTNGKMHQAKQLTSGSLSSTQRCHPTPSLFPAPSSERPLNPSRLPVYLLPLLEAKILGISFIIRFQGGKKGQLCENREVSPSENRGWGIGAQFLWAGPGCEMLQPAQG